MAKRKKKTREDKELERIAEKPLFWIREALDLVHLGNLEVKTSTALLVIATYFDEVNHVLLSGESSSGKSDLLKNCLQFSEREDYLFLIGATEASLKNAGDLIASKKFIVFAEFDATKPGSKDESLDMIMRMLSSEDIGGDYLKCVQTGKDWDVQTMQIEPKSIFSTYAKGTHTLGNENENRLWIFEPKQSKTQVKNVISNIICKDQLEKLHIKNEFDFKTTVFRKNIIRKLLKFDRVLMEFDYGKLTKKQYLIKQGLQTLTKEQEAAKKLKRYFQRKIYIPYMETIGFMFKDADVTRATRDIKRFINLLKIITKLHVSIDNKSRAVFTTIEKDIDNKSIETDWYIAESQDFALTCELSWLTVQQNMKSLTDADIHIYQTLISMYWDELNRDIDYNDYGFSPRDVAKKSEVSYEYCRKRIYNLARLGKVKAGKDPRNKSRTYTWLPELEQELIQNWAIYKADVDKETLAFFESRKIKKKIEKDYSIYKSVSEIPENKLSSEDLFITEIYDMLKKREKYDVDFSDITSRKKSAIDNYAN